MRVVLQPWRGEEPLSMTTSAETTDEPILPTEDDINSVSQEIQKVIDAYDAFRQSSKNNDWAKMGEALQKLDDAIGGIR